MIEMHTCSVCRVPRVTTTCTAEQHDDNRRRSALNLDARIPRARAVLGYWRQMSTCLVVVEHSSSVYARTNRQYRAPVVLSLYVNILTPITHTLRAYLRGIHIHIHAVSGPGFILSDTVCVCVCV